MSRCDVTQPDPTHSPRDVTPLIAGRPLFPASRHRPSATIVTQVTHPFHRVRPCYKDGFLSNIVTGLLIWLRLC